MRTLLTMRTSTSIVGKDKGGTGHTLCAPEAKSDGARCASGTYADRFGVYRSTTTSLAPTVNKSAPSTVILSALTRVTANGVVTLFFFTGSSQTRDGSEVATSQKEVSRYRLSATTDTEIATLLEG